MKAALVAGRPQTFGPRIRIRRNSVVHSAIYSVLYSTQYYIVLDSIIYTVIHSIIAL